MENGPAQPTENRDTGKVKQSNKVSHQRSLYESVTKCRPDHCKKSSIYLSRRLKPRQRPEPLRRHEVSGTVKGDSVRYWSQRAGPSWPISSKKLLTTGAQGPKLSAGSAVDGWVVHPNERRASASIIENWHVPEISVAGPREECKRRQVDQS